MVEIDDVERFLKRFKEQTNLDYITADLYSPIADVKADICNLPFKDNEFDYIFIDENKYPGAPSVQQNVLENNPFLLGNLEVIPVEVNHGKLKIFGYRFKNIAYLTDVKSIDAVEKEKLKNLHIAKLILFLLQVM